MSLLGNSGEKFELPHEHGEWIEWRPLTWDELDRARKAQGRAFIEAMQGIDLSAMRDAVSDVNNADVIAAREKMGEAKEEIDKRITLNGGIIRWSYDSKVNAESIARLDPATATVMYNIIRDASVRTTAEGEASSVN